MVIESLEERDVDEPAASRVFDKVIDLPSVRSSNNPRKQEFFTNAGFPAKLVAKA